MSKANTILGSAVFFVVAPLLLSGFVPWWITRWEFWSEFFGYELTRTIGLLVILSGVPGIVDSFARFALHGLGTPAPVAPTQKLVVTRLYRYARNPMHIPDIAVIFGQALLLGDQRLLWYGVLFFLACHIFVVVCEEPTLRHSFGNEYEAYRANVPRWIPRLTPWQTPLSTTMTFGASQSCL